MGNVISLDPLIKRVCDGVVEFCYDFAVKHAAYVYYLQHNLQALETNLQDLQTLRKELTRRIKVKQGYRMQTSERVGLWIMKVDKEITRGDRLKTEGDYQLDRLCLAGICSTHYLSSSVFGGQVDKCVKELNSLKSSGEGFTDEDLVVQVPAELDRGAKKPCGSTVGLEAKLAEVLRYLEKENVGIVGVYGQGGVGKTTLLKEINNHFVRRSEFFWVIWIDVPKDVNLETIQQAIGEKIGLPNELRGTSMEEKAAYIFKKLQKNKIILLLDDIRKAINLSKIGIPPSDCLNESKVVFTTRPQHACIKMEPKPGRSTNVNTLGDEQAWQLFAMLAGEDIIDSHPQISQLARRVVKKCAGLPLALSIIGKAMSCEREPKVWEHTVKTFERPSLHSNAHQEADGDSMSELFSILRYSYDSLPNETYKSCFLYCALLPEASEIEKKSIIERWLFEGFWIDSVDDDDLDPCYEAYRILNVLTSSCLLEDRKDRVRMHDVVRSMALWIGKEDTLSMAGMELEETPSVRRWEQKKRVSLMDNYIQELTEVPACPNLLALFLCYNKPLNEICVGFFESMGMLTVLDISSTSVEELPESISKLVSLKYLNLSYTNITELPVGLIKLKELRYLGLTGLHLRLLRKNQIICHLSSLQYLGMLSCTYYYEDEEDEEEEKEKAGGEISKGGGDDEILLEELQVLENLKVLEITLQSFSGIIKLFKTRRLLKRIRSLSLTHFTAPESIDISLLAQSKHLETLAIGHCDFKELKNSQESTDSILKGSTSSVLTQMISFNSITMLAVGDCNYLEDITSVVSMPNLRRLYVVDCERLREIVSREKIGEAMVGNSEEVQPVFSSLAILLLEGLPALKSIYPSNTLPVRFLYDLTVWNCPQLKKLPIDPNSSVLECSQIELTAEQKWWDAVEWEDDDAKAALLPRFKLYNLS